MNLWGKSREFKGTPILSKIPSLKNKAGGGNIYWWSFFLVLALDIASKWLVTHTLVMYQSIPLWKDILCLTYIRNPGGAFSFLASYVSPWLRAFFISIAIIAFVVLSLTAHRERYRGACLQIPLGLVSGGAVGNLLDRIFVGTVVDFIEVSYRSFHWPVFNLADSAVDIGVIWLIWLTLTSSPANKRSTFRK